MLVYISHIISSLFGNRFQRHIFYDSPYFYRWENESGDNLIIWFLQEHVSWIYPLDLLVTMDWFPPKIKSKTRMFPPLIAIQHGAKSSSQCSKGRKRNKKHSSSKSGIKAVIIHRQYDCLYRKFNGICKKATRINH